MMIKNKRILLICRESYSFPLFFIAEKFISQNNQVSAFFVYPEESVYKKSYYNINTYFAFKERFKGLTIYDLIDLCDDFSNNLKSNNYASDKYLEQIEKKYTNFKNLTLQLISSQSTTRHFHNRFYYEHTTLRQNHLYLELGYKKVLQVFDEFKPEIIIDSEDSELIRTILNEVAFSKKIPYINIDYPRYEKYKIPTFCLGLRVEDFFINEYNKFYSDDIEKLDNEINYVQEMRSKNSIMSNEFFGTTTSQYQATNIFLTIKFLLVKILYFVNVYLVKKNIFTIKKNILFTSPLKHFLFYFKVEIKKQILYRKNKYFELPRNGDHYVYMPLHLVPESTTFVKAPFYINELTIIEQVSKSLPISWVLYVKEHQSMVGERSLSFYKAIKKFPNVKLVQFNYFNDPKPWIENSKGVITISGSSAYEAAMLGIKSIVFGEVPFKLIEGVSRVSSFEELPKLISSLGKINNLKSCAAYIATVKSIGFEINLKFLISESEAILNGDLSKSRIFENQIESLLCFYQKAYAIYQEHNTCKINEE